MLISSKHLVTYLPRISFPVAVLAEKDDRVLFHLEKDQLQVLIMKGMVVGVGNKNRVRKIRINTPDPEMRKEVERIWRESSHSRRAFKYHYREEMENKPVCLKRLTPEGNFEYWDEQARFPDNRFNPDRIPAPLRPY